MSKVSVVQPLRDGGSEAEPIIGSYHTEQGSITLTIPADAKVVILSDAHCKNGNYTAKIAGSFIRGQTSFLIAEELNGVAKFRTVTVSWTETTVKLPALPWVEVGPYSYRVYCTYTVL